MKLDKRPEGAKVTAPVRNTVDPRRGTMMSSVTIVVDVLSPVEKAIGIRSSKWGDGTSTDQSWNTKTSAG